MALDDYLDSGAGIAAVATALLLSPRARPTARSGAASVGSALIKVASIVVRGTRNLQEAEKHVTKFGVEGEDEGRLDPREDDAPATKPPTL
jgi:hypothetical protein